MTCRGGSTPKRYGRGSASPPPPASSSGSCAPAASSRRRPAEVYSWDLSARALAALGLGRRHADRLDVGRVPADLHRRVEAPVRDRLIDAVAEDGRQSPQDAGLEAALARAGGEVEQVALRRVERVV